MGARTIMPTADQLQLAYHCLCSSASVNPGKTTGLVCRPGTGLRPITRLKHLALLQAMGVHSWCHANPQQALSAGPPKCCACIHTRHIRSTGQALGYRPGVRLQHLALRQGMGPKAAILSRP